MVVGGGGRRSVKYRKTKIVRYIAPFRAHYACWGAEKSYLAPSGVYRLDTRHWSRLAAAKAVTGALKNFRRVRRRRKYCYRCVLTFRFFFFFVFARREFARSFFDSCDNGVLRNHACVVSYTTSGTLLVFYANRYLIDRRTLSDRDEWCLEIVQYTLQFIFTFRKSGNT